jgi:hypothetical protein
VVSIFFFGAVVLILILKSIELGWFAPQTPLALNNQPALLFFNNDRGCECAMFVYRHAEAQLSAWPDEKHSGIPIIPVNLERRPDLAQEYQVIRAPTLLLLDSAGQILWRQDEVISDEFPFDLIPLESQIEILKAGK